MDSIYDNRRRAKNAIESIENSKFILTKNKELMFEFKDDCLAQGIGLSRITKCLYILKNVSIWLKKEFTACETRDIKELLGRIELMENYSPRTKVDYRGVIKKFFKWISIKGIEIDTSWIKTSFKKHNDKLPSELLNEDDIIKMVNNSKNPRDRAMITGLYESGCRIGEFLKIKLKDLIFEKPGCLFMVNGKTGGRRIRVISSEPYIIEWINKHPDNKNPESFLWLNNNKNEMLAYSAFCKILKVIGRRAGITKKVNPHNFRHARATYLASRFTEQQLKVFFGWTRASDMASVYVHLSGKDVDDALLEVYGIEKESKESRITKLKPCFCNLCKTQNETTNKVCKVCGFILEENERLKVQAKESDNKEVNNVMNLLLKDKEILDLISRKMKEISV